jgi:hypothetical protein
VSSPANSITPVAAKIEINNLVSASDTASSAHTDWLKKR